MCENLTLKQVTKIVNNSLSYYTRNTYNISSKHFSVLLLSKNIYVQYYNMIMIIIINKRLRYNNKSLERYSLLALQTMMLTGGEMTIF